MPRCGKATPGWFQGIARKPGQTKLVVWVLRAYRTVGWSPTSQGWRSADDGTLQQRFGHKDATFLLTRATKITLDSRVSEQRIAVGDFVDAHVSVCGPPTSPTALIARTIQTTHTDGAEAPPPPTP